MTRVSWQALAALAAALTAGVTACTEILHTYDFELHISRVWSEREGLPERLQ